MVSEKVLKDRECGYMSYCFLLWAVRVPRTPKQEHFFAKVIIFPKQCQILCPNHLFMKVVSLHFAREVTFCLAQIKF